MPKKFPGSSLGFAPILVLAIVAILATTAFGYLKLSQSDEEIFPDKSPKVSPSPFPSIITPLPSVLPSSTAKPSSVCQTCQTKVSDKTLDDDLKSLDNLDSSVSSGLSNVDSGLNDKGDNLVE